MEGQIGSLSQCLETFLSADLALSLDVFGQLSIPSTYICHLVTKPPPKVAGTTNSERWVGISKRQKKESQHRWKVCNCGITICFSR
jgi:hypothetical protein